MYDSLGGDIDSVYEDRINRSTFY